MSQNQTAILSAVCKQSADELLTQIHPEGLQHYFTMLALLLLFFSQMASLMHSIFSYKQLCWLSLQHFHGSPIDLSTVLRSTKRLVQFFFDVIHPQIFKGNQKITVEM